ncbi:hypothetical protein GCM10022223_28270 [Kineosporia mesophila]|uniref:Uncharacterized protein n=1 Tax=Kineosporia mesophila TaxID=566012 RepID=A0ABP6ZI40_9ACTN|nr:hypothetical protein [Kineosporia mesophila]MCD5353440.1 hypothetical protein [Kineosporia mesophila]
MENQLFGPLNQHGRDYRPLNADRARSRLSAYVYGNILVLAAVIGATGEGEHSRSWLILLATALSTYAAHIFSHNIGERVGRSDAEHVNHLREEIRDAVPILTSGVFPALIYAGSALHWYGSRPAEITATALLLLRLAGTGLAVERLSDRRVSAAALWAGIVFALVGAGIAYLKVIFTH